MLSILVSIILAQTTPDVCFNAEYFKKHVIEHGGRWTELTHDQRLFVAGVSLLHPQTPMGLPPGDKAVLIVKDDTYTVLFLDDEKACNPMSVNKTFFDELNHLNDVRHIDEHS